MLLKGEWKEGKAEEIAHFLLNQSIKKGHLYIKANSTEINIYLSGGNVRYIELNGRPVRSLWEIKGALISIFETKNVRFEMRDDLPPKKGDLNIYFPRLILEVITFNDELMKNGVKVPKPGMLKISGIPVGGDEEEFVRTLRMKYKNDIPLGELFKEYSHVSPRYLSYLISRLEFLGYAKVVEPEEIVPIQPKIPLNKGDTRIQLSPFLLALLSFTVSAISAVISAIVIFKLLNAH